MAEFQVITLTEDERWEAIVNSFPRRDVYYLSGYVKGFAAHGDGEPLLLYYEAGGLRAMNVVMRRDIHDFAPLRAVVRPREYYDLATPYGYGGLVLDGPADAAALTALGAAYERFARQYRVVSEFTRFHPILNNADDNRSLCEVTRVGPAVVLDISSKSGLWGDLTAKARNRIRKGENDGIVVRRGFSPELLTEFQTIYNKNMDYNQARDYYYFQAPFYNSLQTDLRDHCEIFYASQDGKVVAMVLFTIAGGILQYHLGGTDPDYLTSSPTNSIIYAAACFGNGIGARYLNLGGGVGGREDSLYNYKKRFSKTSDYTFYSGRKIYDTNVYEQLMQARGELTDETYFPAYRG